MNKTEQINKLISEGKSFEEVEALKIAKPGFVKKLFTEAGVPWKKEETQEPEAAKEVPQEEPVAPESAPQVVGTIDPQTLAIAMQMAQQMMQQQPIVAPKPEVRVEVEKCIRHPHIDVKPGENCPECIKQSRLYEERMSQSNFILPCPQCGQDKHVSRGGTIQYNYRKKSYSCGNCQITYTAKEKTPWGVGDWHHI